MSALPLFPVTTVGSWPRTRGCSRRPRTPSAPVVADRLERALDVAVHEVVQAQHRAGVDLVTDGEQSRDNFYRSLRTLTASGSCRCRDARVRRRQGIVQPTTARRRACLLDPQSHLRGPAAATRPLTTNDVARLRRFRQAHQGHFAGPYIRHAPCGCPGRAQRLPSKEALGDDVSRSARRGRASGDRGRRLHPVRRTRAH
jgi:hypothetical protein